MTHDQFLQAVEILQPGTTAGIYPFTSTRAAIRIIGKRLNIDLTNVEGELYSDVLRLLFQHIEKCDNRLTHH